MACDVVAGHLDCQRLGLEPGAAAFGAGLLALVARHLLAHPGAVRLRDIVTRLHVSLGALTALGAALDARATGSPLHPTVQGPLNQILSALGAREAMEGVGPAEMRALVLV